MRKQLCSWHLRRDCHFAMFDKIISLYYMSTYALTTTVYLEFLMSGIKGKCKDFIVCFLNVLLSNNNKMIYLTTNTILNKWKFAKDKNCNLIFHYQRNLKLLRFRQWILFNYHLARLWKLQTWYFVFRY